MASLPVVSPSLTETEYEAIEAAVTETARGRWFLTEYARRNRTADTTTLLAALDRIEAVVRGERTVEAVDRIRFDLVEMAKAIARTKAEIAAIKPDADHQGRIGVATEELDSIVSTTELATSEILAAAEHIQEYAWTLRERGVDAEICDVLDTRATEIYTACSFQDLTGQRTRKVIHVLRYLESRINAMIDIWGLKDASPPAPEHAAADNPDRALLNGPARPGEGLDQSDVDMVMGPARPLQAARPDEPAPAPTPAAPPSLAAADAVTDATAGAAIMEPLPVEVSNGEVIPSVMEPEYATPQEGTRAPTTAEALETDVVAVSGTTAAEDDTPMAAHAPELPGAAPPLAAETMPAHPDAGPGTKRNLAALDPVMALSDEERIALFS